MKRSCFMIGTALVCITVFLVGVASGYAQTRELSELEKKIEKAQTPEKREAITKIRDVHMEYRQNTDALSIADLILKADRNVWILEKLAEYGIRQGGVTPLYISLAKQAAKAPLADQEFLRLAEIFKKQGDRYHFQVIPKLGKAAARAKTESDLSKVREEISRLESLLPGATKVIEYEEKKVQPYVAWLRNNAESPVDYILDLFKTHDMVIIAERLHPETTQWDFFWELTSDPRFVENVGNIFTEYGSVSQQPELDQFMNTPLPAEDRDREIINLLRNFPVWPIGWTNNNIFDYLGKLHTLNQQLEPHKRLSLFFSDIPWEWEGKTQKEFDKRQSTILKHRDEIMADRIGRKFKEIQASGSPRKKALVIMNTRHSFGEIYHEGKQGKLFQNAGGFLMQQFPGKVANVMINFIESDYEKAFVPYSRRLIRGVKRLLSDNAPKNESRSNTILRIRNEGGGITTERLAQNGIWDAAFSLADNKPMGFSFKGSPFGKDTFDYLAPIYSMFKYEEVFTGMVFYQPLDRFMSENNIPGYYDGFQEKLVERAKLLGDRYAESMLRTVEIAAQKGNDTGRRSTYPMKLLFKPKR